MGIMISPSTFREVARWLTQGLGEYLPGPTGLTTPHGCGHRAFDLAIGVNTTIGGVSGLDEIDTDMRWICNVCKGRSVS